MRSSGRTQHFARKVGSEEPGSGQIGQFDAPEGYPELPTGRERQYTYFKKEDGQWGVRRLERDGELPPLHIEVDESGNRLLAEGLVDEGPPTRFGDAMSREQALAQLTSADSQSSLKPLYEMAQRAGLIDDADLLAALPPQVGGMTEDLVRHKLKDVIKSRVLDSMFTSDGKALSSEESIAAMRRMLTPELNSSDLGNLTEDWYKRFAGQFGDRPDLIKHPELPASATSIDNARKPDFVEGSKIVEVKSTREGLHQRDFQQLTDYLQTAEQRGHVVVGDNAERMVDTVRIVFTNPEGAIGSMDDLDELFRRFHQSLEVEVFGSSGSSVYKTFHRTRIGTGALMPTPRDLRFTLSCPRGSEMELFKSLLDTELVKRGPDGARLGPPTRIKTQGGGFIDMDAFYTAWAAEDRPIPDVSWSGRKMELEGKHRHWSCFVSADHGYVKIGNLAFPVTAQFVLQLLREHPFDVAGVSRLDQGWPEPSEGPWFGFSEGHYLHGFACAFKGPEGHARLVHRRWLEHGPWRLIRDESCDLSFVQFHALDASVPEAVAQAAAGHERIGQSAVGGFISRHTRFGSLKLSLHDPGSSTSIVVVPAGQTVAIHEMFEAAAVKALQPYPDLHIEQVAFVFASEDEAHAQLHDLWLYGLEVRAITSRGEVRLDEAYAPTPPAASDWVERERDLDGLG